MNRTRNSILLVASLVAALIATGCLGGKKSKHTNEPVSSAEPDKLLYERAMDDNKHGRYTVARLSLQTLINTYPDSEYLAKAKLAIAESYFKEGGTAGLTQSVTEYKDFITFFPFLDEAAYAQMQVGMAHYRMMEKPDRDRTQARLAEDEFQTFLLKYPQNPIADQAAQRLREVQEVLAEGDFRVARYYYVKRSYRSAAARLLDLTDRYTLYSQGDRARWMLADIYERAEKRELADRYYASIIRDYPLSPLVEPSKKKLIAAGIPVPQPDPAALARLQKEQEFAKAKRSSLLHRSMGMIKNGPDVSSASHSGPPNLTPYGETTSGGDILKPGGNSVGGVGGGGARSIAVETVPAGSGSTYPPPASNPASTAGSPVAGDANPATTETGGTAAASSGNSPAGSSPAAGPATTPDPSQVQAEKDKKKKEKESSSKKKKGLRKLIPW